jgi:hypothetical protein
VPALPCRLAASAVPQCQPGFMWFVHRMTAASSSVRLRMSVGSSMLWLWTPQNPVNVAKPAPVKPLRAFKSTQSPRIHGKSLCHESLLIQGIDLGF